MAIRGVLFDLDGTLLDHRTAVVEALHAWLPSLGVTVTPALVEHWHAVTERHLADWRLRRIDFAEQRRRRVREFLPDVGVRVEGDEEVLFDVYLQGYQRAWRPFDDAWPAVAAVVEAGLRVAVLTNGSRPQQLRKLATIGLLDQVGPIYTPDDLGFAKPAPEAFTTACARWGLVPGEVLHVGDVHELDVVAARAAGLRAVHLDRFDERKEHLRLTTLGDLMIHVGKQSDS